MSISTEIKNAIPAADRPAQLKQAFRVNNFDFIRLFAALQVAILHSISYLDLSEVMSGVILFLELFPGVPIFFFVSGFLISKSYESNPKLSEYAQNRVLRIYPALFLCTILSMLSVYITGYFTDKGISFAQALPWIVSQFSVAQFYTPSFMRDYGVGTLNGSLWTISVELQFYLVVPVVYYFLKKSAPKNNNFNIISLIVFFVIAHSLVVNLGESNPDNMLLKLTGVSFLPWVYMFLVGMLFQKNFEKLHSLFADKAIVILPTYIALAYALTHYGNFQLGNTITPELYPLLAITVFSVAYSTPSLSKRLFKGNDYSYGIYIYHIPVINLMVTYGLTDHVAYLYLTLIASCTLAAASWWLLEKPCLSLKRQSLKVSTSLDTNPGPSTYTVVRSRNTTQEHSVEHAK